MIMRSIQTAVKLAVMALVLGCSSATTQRSSERGAANTLTNEQLARTNAETVYDAVTRLRPGWFTSRGPTSVTDMTSTEVSVFMNGNSLGKSEVLRQMRIAEVASVKYWDASSASARFGMGHPRGVIEVIPK